VLGNDAVTCDVLIIGAGVMGATLAALLHELEPAWEVVILERLDRVAGEASEAWHNSGTGHAGLCEINYTPESDNGSIDTTKAVSINRQFETTMLFYQHWQDLGFIDLENIWQTMPHLSFVTGANDVDFLHRRYTALKRHSEFTELEFTAEPTQIAQWAPLIMRDRELTVPMAATRATNGKDVDFGELTRQLIAAITTRADSNVSLRLDVDVTGLSQADDATWQATTREGATFTAQFVFVAAGGGTLPLLQKANVPEISGYGGYPISGKFLRCSNPEIVSQLNAKVYGKAAIGAPPMSVPHLDTRVIDGEKHLMFGPFAGFTPAFLKYGAPAGLLTSLRPHNVPVMLQAGLANLDLTQYLITEIFANSEKRLTALRQFYPDAQGEDWELIEAGRRVQIIKPNPAGGGTLEFGTELIVAADRTIAALLGASPGASTAPAIMLELLARAFPAQFPAWRAKLPPTPP